MLCNTMTSYADALTDFTYIGLQWMDDVELPRQWAIHRVYTGAVRWEPTQGSEYPVEDDGRAQDYGVWNKCEVP